MRARVRWPQANLFAVLVFSGLRFGDFALAQPVAFAVHLEDMDVVGQAIENGACEAFCAEDPGPFVNPGAKRGKLNHYRLMPVGFRLE